MQVLAGVLAVGGELMESLSRQIKPHLTFCSLGTGSVHVRHPPSSTYSRPYRVLPTCRLLRLGDNLRLMSSQLTAQKVRETRRRQAGVRADILSTIVRTPS